MRKLKKIRQTHIAAPENIKMQAWDTESQSDLLGFVGKIYLDSADRTCGSLQNGQLHEALLPEPFPPSPMPPFRGLLSGISGLTSPRAKGGSKHTEATGSFCNNVKTYASEKDKNRLQVWDLPVSAHLFSCVSREHSSAPERWAVPLW